MNWLHDDLVANGIWSPEGTAQPIIAPALAAAPEATVIDASAIARYWFDRTNPEWRWNAELPTFMPSARVVFIEARAPRRHRLEDGWSDRWPWPYRRWGVLLVATDLRRRCADPDARRAAALIALQTIESWQPERWRSTAIIEEPHWGIAFHLVGDQGKGAPALLGAGVLVVQPNGALAHAVTADPDQVPGAARAVFIAPSPRTSDGDERARDAFEQLLPPLLFANSCMFVDNETELLVSAAIAPPTRIERMVPGQAPSRHLSLSLAGFPAVLAEAGADRPHGLETALWRCRDRFVTTTTEERNARTA